MMQRCLGLVLRMEVSLLSVTLSFIYLSAFCQLCTAGVPPLSLIVAVPSDLEMRE